MKPDLRMEGEKPTAVSFSIMPEQPVKPKWSTQKKITFGAILGLVSLVVVASVVIMSVYVGSKFTEVNYKKASQIFTTSDGRVTDEETSVSKDTVKVKVPNEVEAVYDYVHGLVVERYVDAETKQKTPCFARYMNASQSPSREAGDYGDNGQVSLTSPKNSSEQEEKWVSTDKLVPRFLISESVDRMCQGTNIYWMERTQIDGTEKRAVYYVRTIVYTNTCLPVSGRPCLYYCQVAHVYYNDQTRQYSFVYTWAYYCNTYCPYYC